MCRAEIILMEVTFLYLTKDYISIVILNILKDNQNSYGASKILVCLDYYSLEIKYFWQIGNIFFYRSLTNFCL